MVNDKKTDPKEKIKKKIGTGKINNEIEVNPLLKESFRDTAVFTFGRMNPPTIGHQKLVHKLRDVASKNGGVPLIFLSHSEDIKKNPLSYKDKISLAIRAFSNLAKTIKSNSKNVIDVVKELEQSNFRNIVMVVGQDRVKEMETLLNKYNGKEYNFESISVVSAGDRDPDADDVSGMSASKMRALAKEGDLATFRKGLPAPIQNNAQEIMDMVRAGMDLAEELEIEGMLEEGVLTIAQRRKRAMTMRRYKGKIAMARRRLANRMPDAEHLERRAKKRAIQLIRRKVAGPEKAAKYKDLSPAEKTIIDQRVAKRSKVIAKIAKRMLPRVRKDAMIALAAKRGGKSASGSNGGVAEGIEFQDYDKVKKNKVDGRKFRQMYRKDGKINIDQRLKVFRKPSIEESAIINEAWEAAHNDDPLNLALKALLKRTGNGEGPEKFAFDIVKQFNLKMTPDELIRRYENADLFDNPHYFDMQRKTELDRQFDDYTNAIINPTGLEDWVAAFNGYPTNQEYPYAADVEHKTDTGDSFASYRRQRMYNAINESAETLLEDMQCALISKSDIRELEKFADNLLDKYKIDIEFTKHFGDRMSDDRNTPCITIKELKDFFRKVYANQGMKIKGAAGIEAVLKDVQKSLNMPVIIDRDQKGEVDVKFKTIMRKKNFTSPNRQIRYEHKKFD